MEIKSGLLEVPGSRLYYEEAGSGQPVVLVHGMTLDRRMWDDQFAPFAEQFRVIRYDARGFGRSDLPKADEPFAQEDDLKAVLDALSIDQASLIGLSMGGGTVIDFAFCSPERTRALVAVDAAVNFRGHRPTPEVRDLLGGVSELARTAGFEKARERWLTSSLFAPANEQPAVAARLRQMVEEYPGWHWVNTPAPTGREIPTVDRLGEITAPTLVVVGDRDLSYFLTGADLLVERLPNARKAAIVGAGHMPNMEDPARFNQVVLEFLTGLPA